MENLVSLTANERLDALLSMFDEIVAPTEIPSFYVYAILNNVNRKVYIGAHQKNSFWTCSHETMWWDESQESVDLDKYYRHDYQGSSKHLLNAYRKYGKTQFRKILLARCSTMEEAYAIEAMIVCKEFVKIHASSIYNLTPGGKSKFPVKKSSLHRKRISMSLKGIKRGPPWNTGIAMSAEIRKNMSEGRKGMKLSTEHKRNIGDAHIGMRRSQSTKNNIRNALKGNLNVKNYIWLTNGKTNIRRKIEETSSYLADGWFAGRTNNGKLGRKMKTK